jgi:hypothetical protein
LQWGNRDKVVVLDVVQMQAVVVEEVLLSVLEHHFWYLVAEVQVRMLQIILHYMMQQLLQVQIEVMVIVAVLAELVVPVVAAATVDVAVVGQVAPVLIVTAGKEIMVHMVAILGRMD